MENKENKFVAELETKILDEEKNVKNTKKVSIKYLEVLQKTEMELCRKIENMKLRQAEARQESNKKPEQIRLIPPPVKRQKVQKPKKQTQGHKCQHCEYSD